MGNLQLLIATVAILVATAALPAEAAVADIVTADFFNGIKNQAPNSCPGKNFYTSYAFLEAAKAYPEFGNRGYLVSEREIAAFFAHVSHETGSMCHIEQINRGTYCDPRQYTCTPGKKYYGRGALQLRGNSNYAMCGQANNFNGLGDPDIVARDPVLAWKTAVWFWMKNVRPILSQGFGPTIRAINGNECNGGNPAAVRSRVRYYTSYCQKFGLQPEGNTGC